MKHGDVVIPTGGNTLDSGGQQYKCAIVCWLDPLILVSADSKAVWDTGLRPEKFEALCRADSDIIYQAMKRLPEELQAKHQDSQPPSAAEIYGAMEEHSDRALLATLSCTRTSPSVKSFYDNLAASQSTLAAGDTTPA